MNKSWRTTVFGAIASALYMASQMEDPTWQDWCLAGAIIIGSYFARDAKVSSQDENLRPNVPVAKPDTPKDDG